MEDIMRIRIVCLIAIASVAAPAAVFAQSADTKYCDALTASYDKYVESSGGRGGKQAPMATVETAKSKCQSDPASAIPVLEGVLKDNKLSLPSRN